jgi:hypothetical protein
MPLACDPGTAERRLRPRQIVAGVLGLGLIAVGVVLSSVSLSTIAITVGALVLLFGAAWGWASQIQLGGPFAQVSFTPDKRQQLLRQQIDNHQGLLSYGVDLLCADRDSALKVVALCSSTVTTQWRGRDEALKAYLACVLVARARTDALVHPGTPVAGGTAALSRDQREAFVLCVCFELSDDQAASILGMPAAAVRKSRTEAATILGHPGEAP